MFPFPLSLRSLSLLDIAYILFHESRSLGCTSDHCSSDERQMMSVVLELVECVALSSHRTVLGFELILFLELYEYEKFIMLHTICKRHTLRFMFLLLSHQFFIFHHCCCILFLVSLKSFIFCCHLCQLCFCFFHYMS